MGKNDNVSFFNRSKVFYSLANQERKKKTHFRMCGYWEINNFWVVTVTLHHTTTNYNSTLKKINCFIPYLTYHGPTVLNTHSDTHTPSTHSETSDQCRISEFPYKPQSSNPMSQSGLWAGSSFNHCGLSSEGCI